MTLREPGALGWVLRGAVFLAIALVALVAQLDRSARIQPALIAYVPAGLGGFADETAARLLALTDPKTAMARGEALLRQRPIEAANLSAYALAAVEADETAKASQALTYAAQRGWRDPYTQVTVLGSALAGKQWDVAAQRVDALARMRREEEAVFGTISLLINEPDGRRALSQRMAESPPLVTSIADFLRANPTFGPAVADTFVLTRGQETALECEDYARVVRTLLGNAQGSDALKVWPEHCMTREDKSTQFLFAEDMTSPFAWTFPSGAGISIRSGDGEGSLDVRNRDPLRRQFAFRYVTLPAGTHTLSLLRSDESGVRRPGAGPSADVSILLRCDRIGGNSGGALIGEVYRGPSQFTVPADCPAQFLALTASQGRIEGLKIEID